MNPFFNISEEEKKELIKHLETNFYEFKKNSSLLETIKNTNFIGIIIKGCIQIIKNDYNGNRIIIEELKENQMFGSKISSINSECKIVAKEITKVLIIDYIKIIKNNYNNEYYNQFIKNILEFTVNSINEKNNRIEILTKKTIRNRLLEYFKIMSLKNKSKIIYLPFSFTDLADYLAIDRCAMSRELKNLKNEGFIEIKNRKIHLLY